MTEMVNGWNINSMSQEIDKLQVIMLQARKNVLLSVMSKQRPPTPWVSEGWVNMSQQSYSIAFHIWSDCGRLSNILDSS